MGPTVCLNPLENIKISCLYPATGRAVSTFVIIAFLFLLCSGFYTNLPHLSRVFCLIFLSLIFLSMLFAINISYSTYLYLFSLLYSLTPQPFTVSFSFIPLLIFLSLLLSSLLAFCMLVLLTFPCYTPSSHPGTLSFYHNLQTARPKAHQSGQMVQVTQSTEPHSRGPHPADTE